MNGELDSLLAKCVPFPHYRTKVDFLYGEHNIQDTTNLKEANLIATSNMFTKDDIDAITPLQITTYLTMEEHEEICTKVLCSKLLKKGYKVVDGKNNVCDTCNMPRLSVSDQLVETCATCPILKMRVLEKILDGCS